MDGRTKQIRTDGRLTVYQGDTQNKKKAGKKAKKEKREKGGKCRVRREDDENFDDTPLVRQSKKEEL